MKQGEVVELPIIKMEQGMNDKTPKYMMVAQLVKSQIQEGILKYGDKIDSENELSRRFNLSRQTIRQGIGMLEQEKFVLRVQGSGTYVSYKPRMLEETMNIGIISTYLDQYIFPSIIKGIENILTPKGYSMQIALTHNRFENEARALKSMIDKGVDGFIIEPTKSALPNPNMQIYRHICKNNLPVIFFNAFYPNTPYPYVSIDDKKAGEIATNFLLDNGHRNILGIFKFDDIQGHLRYSGFQNALNEHQILEGLDNVMWFATGEMDNFCKDNAVFLENIKKNTAILCYNDELAFNIITYLQTIGIKVPDDISIMGIDNSNVASLCNIPLSTVTHPGEKLGECAAQNLMSLIKDPEINANKIFVPELVVRKSVKNIV